jgi:hypothetical protein
VGGWAARMPCGHWFSSEPLLQWLSQQNTCPVCRYELVTEDDEYNHRKNLTLEVCAAAAESASMNPGDFLYIRLKQAMQESVLDFIAEQASRYVAMMYV